MKVSDLMELLKNLNPQAQVVISREVLNYGFGSVKRLGFGIFEKTEYGNDFHENQSLIIKSTEVKAVCLFPEDYEVPSLQEKEVTQNG